MILIEEKEYELGGCGFVSQKRSYMNLRIEKNRLEKLGFLPVESLRGENCKLKS